MKPRDEIRHNLLILNMIRILGDYNRQSNLISFYNLSTLNNNQILKLFNYDLNKIKKDIWNTKLVSFT